MKHYENEAFFIEFQKNFIERSVDIIIRNTYQ